MMLITFLFLSSRQMPILAWQPACLMAIKKLGKKEGCMVEVIVNHNRLIDL